MAPLAPAGFEAEGDAVDFDPDAVTFVAEADMEANVEELPGLATLVKAGVGGKLPPVFVSTFVGIGFIGTIVEAVEIGIVFPVAEGVTS